MLHLDTDSDDKELVAIYEQLLQYFEPFGYSRRQLVEAIKEANVGPQLNDFNVNRLFEFLSFHSEAPLEDKKDPKQPTAPEGLGNDKEELPATTVGTKSDATSEVTYEKAKPVECGLTKNNKVQEKHEELPSSFDFMICQLKVLGYTDVQARKGVTVTNVSPFVTDENINKVVEYLELQKDIPETTSLEHDTCIPQIPDFNETLSEAGNAPCLSTATQPLYSKATSTTGDSSKPTTSAKIRALHEHSLLQDNSVSSTSDNEPGPSEGGSRVMSPYASTNKPADNNAFTIQDDTVSSFSSHCSNSQPSVKANTSPAPVSLTPSSGATLPVPNLQSTSENDNISKNPDPMEQTTNSTTFSTLVSSNESFSIHSLPSLNDKVQKPSDEANSETPVCLSDPTVNVVITTQLPSSIPTQNGKEPEDDDLVLHSVSLKSHVSTFSTPHSATKINEIDGFEEMRSKVEPFNNDEESENSSCHHSCDGDSESLHSYTLLSDPSVVVEQTSNENNVTAEDAAIDSSTPDKSVTPTRKPQVLANEKVSPKQKVETHPQSMLSLGDIKSLSRNSEDSDAPGQELHSINSKITPFKPENVVDASPHTDSPSTSKRPGDSLTPGQVLSIPYTSDHSLSSIDYSTLDIYNFKTSQPLSGSFKVSEVPKQSDSSSAGQDTEAKLVKITPKELKKQMTAERDEKNAPQPAGKPSSNLLTNQESLRGQKLSNEFNALIKRTRFLGYSEESIVQAIKATNVHPSVSDISIGILSDFIESNMQGNNVSHRSSEPHSQFTKAQETETHNDAHTGNMTRNFFECQQNSIPAVPKQILPLHLAGDASFNDDVDVSVCDETGENKSGNFEPHNENAGNKILRKSNFPMHGDTTHKTKHSSLPNMMETGVEDLVVIPEFHSLVDIKRENLTMYDGMSAPESVAKEQLNSLPVDWNPPDTIQKELHASDLVCPCLTDDEIVKAVVKDLVDSAVDQITALHEAELVIRKQNKIDDEFSALVRKVQRFGFTQHVVEKAIKATNVNPSVGDVTVGTLLDYLHSMPHCSEDEVETEEDDDIQNFDVDTATEEDIKLVIKEMTAYVIHKEDEDAASISMQDFCHFIPQYWLACERNAKQQRRKEETKMYKDLIKAVEKHNYNEMQIKAAIKATNVGPGVNEVNVQCLLEYLQEHQSDDHGNDDAEKSAEELMDLIESLPNMMKEIIEEIYCSLVKHLNNERYAAMTSDDFTPLVKWIKSQNPKMGWSSRNIKQAILYTNVPPQPSEATLIEIRRFLLEKKPELDEKMMVDVKEKICGLSEKVDMELDLTEMLCDEEFLEACLTSSDGLQKAEIQASAFALLKMSEVAPEMLDFIQDYCFSPDDQLVDESLKSETESMLTNVDSTFEDIHHQKMIEEITEEEWKLTKKLNSLCDKNGKEENPIESVPIFHELGKIYRQKSPNKVELLRSAAFFNAAIVRNPEDCDDIREDLHELCMHILQLSGARKANASLIDASYQFLNEVKEMRKKSISSLDSLNKIDGENEYYQDDMNGFKSQMLNIEHSNESFEKKWELISDMIEQAFDPIKSFIEMMELIHEGRPEMKIQEEEKISHMIEIQDGITRDFIHIMKLISEYCVDVLGHPQCNFTQVGMGSLARKEVTPYSDFENMILLEDGIEDRKDFAQIQEYFRWYSVIFQIILINFGETILPCLAIPCLNDFHKHGENWFFDAYSGNGISFDGMMPNACKSPLGWQNGTPDNPGTPKELIQTVSRMVEFVNHDETVDDFHLSDMLMCTCFVAGMPKVYDDYQKLLKSKLDEGKMDDSLNEQARHTMAKDIVKFNGLRGVTDMLLAVKWNVKKTIYRATTIFISALGREECIHSTSSFDIVSELLEKGVIEPHIAHKLKYAVALACEIRLRIYLKKQRQEDWVSSEELPLCDLMMLFDMIGVRSTYDYFSIVIFLNMCIESILERGEVVLPFPDKGLLLCLPHLMEYIICCIDVSFKVGCKMLLKLGNIHLSQIFDDEDVVDIEGVLEVLKTKINPKTCKEVVKALSNFCSFLTSRGYFLEALVCGLIEIYTQLTFLKNETFNLVKWSRNFISNMFDTLSFLQYNWDTVHWIMEFGKADE